MARYADGRAASIATLEARATAAGLALGDETLAWRTLARADDGGGAVVLKRKPDMGERITLSDAEAREARRYAPRLFTGRALRRDHPLFVFSLIATAGALAAGLLFGVPLAADPIARVVPQRYAEQLNVLAWSQVDAITEPCGAKGDTAGWLAVEQLFDRLSAQANVPREAKINLVAADFPNAFTLPDGSIVLTNQMVMLAGSPDELAGVLAHELGHVQARHVLKGVVRQMGLGLFVDIVLGGAGAGQALAAANLLALRYTREDETEADATARTILARAGFNPGAMGPMFRRIAAYQRDKGAGLPEMLSSHPDTLARAAVADRYNRPVATPAMTAEAWQALRAVCPSPQ